MYVESLPDHSHVQVPKAYWRGSPTCGVMPGGRTWNATAFPAQCARSYVSRLSHTNASHLIDAGVTVLYGDKDDEKSRDATLRDGHGPLPLKQEMPKVRFRSKMVIDSIKGNKFQIERIPLDSMSCNAL